MPLLAFTADDGGGTAPNTQLLLLAGVGAVLDFWVLWGYAGDVIMVHPKFLANWKRRLAVTIHVAAGGLEIFAAMLRMLCPTMGCLLAASYLQALLGAVHALTCFVQMRALFGVPALMVPAYSMAAGCKLLLAVRLAVRPLSLTVSLQLFVIHSIFSYVRAFFGIWMLTGLFSGYEYTVAVMLAGLVCFPVMGPAANLVAMAVFLVSLAAVALWSPLGRESSGFVEKCRPLLTGLGLEGGAAQRCVQVVLQAQPLLRCNSRKVAYGHGPGAAAAVAAWPVVHLPTGQFQQALNALMRDDEEVQARIAFAALDVDGTGRLTRASLRLLLFHWGRQQPLATELLSIVEDESTDGHITFEVFYSSMRPVWHRLQRIVRAHLPAVHMQHRRHWHLAAELHRPPTSRFMMQQRSFLSR